MRLHLLLILLFTGIIAVNAQQPDATEIIRRSDKLMRGESTRAEMTMRIVRPDWSRDMSMKSWSLGNDYALILVTAPARDKGTAFLKRDKEIWNWQPTIDRVIKLPPSMMMQSWMGSDFTNDDLVKESSAVEDYTHSLLGDTVIRGREAWKIQMLPKEDAAVVWGKVIAYIDKDDYVQLMAKMYDEDGYLVNTMTLSDIREVDGRPFPHKMEIRPADEPGNATIITYQSIVFNEPVVEDYFSIQNMKRIR